MFYNIVRFISGIICRIIYRIEIKGIENVPLEGNLIICANHSNNLDPVILSIAFPRQINWMAKKELFENKGLSYIFQNLGAFPIDRNNADISAIKKALKLLKEQKVLGIFPEGTRVKGLDYNNAKPGTAMIMVKSKAMVQPIYIDGDYKLFKKIKISIGQPINFSDLEVKKYTNENYLEISKDILNNIYSLK